MSENQNVHSIGDLKVEVSGVISWTLLSYALIKISHIYFSDVIIASFVLYNVCSVIYLLFFQGFYRSRFSEWKALRLIAVYNLLLISYESIYRALVLIDAGSILGIWLALAMFINLMLNAVVYLFIKKFRKPQTA